MLINKKENRFAREKTTMKKCIMAFLMLLTVFSCGKKEGNFSITGSLKNMDAGSLYVYSTDNAYGDIDTIVVKNGKFEYHAQYDAPSTIYIVFPNYTQLPVFTEPDLSVKIVGDASHLNELEVKGGKENKLLTNFRKQILNMGNSDIPQLAEQFIKENLKSRVSSYLVKRYFINSPAPDYTKANALMKAILQQQPDNEQLKAAQKDIEQVAKADKGAAIERFSVKDINNNLVTEASVQSAEITVIYTWASWDFESMNIQRQLAKQQAASGDRLKLIGICVDPSIETCRNIVKRDRITGHNICDGQMMDSEIIKKWGLNSLPDNIVLKRGRIIARGLGEQELMKIISKNIP